MSPTNPQDDANAAIASDEDDSLYAHVTVSDSETIIYNPDATDEWVQSTDAQSLDEWL